MIQNITSEEAKKIIDEKKDDLIILDVRTRWEYDSERIDSSILLDISSPAFKEGLERLDKNKTYLVYCRTGARSHHAVIMMEQMGFRNILHLQHGITEWIANGFPVV